MDCSCSGSCPPELREVFAEFIQDPELRRTASGVSVASFSLAVDRDFGNRETGERETDFIDIVAWRSTAEFVSKYFSKGRMAVVSGRLQIRPWTDKDGNKRRSAEVVADNIYFGDSKRDNDNGGYNPGNSYGSGSSYNAGGSYGNSYNAAPSQPYADPYPPAISLCSRTTTASSRSKNFSHDTVKKEDPCYGE